jgi:Ca2+-binding EF-hand superfamily protein
MGNYADNFLRVHDRDRDGKVTFDEFRVAKNLENHLEEGKQRIFDQLDKNRDGEIAREELPGGSPEERGPHWLDKDRDGKISFEEFSASEWLKDATPEERKKHFDRMDLNNDGVLTPEDFRRRPPGSRAWDRRRPLFDPQALRNLDTDEDGALSFEEWSKSPHFENLPEERLREWFDRMDRNDDGRLDEADRPEGPPRPGADDERERPEGPPRRGPGASPKSKDDSR